MWEKSQLTPPQSPLAPCKKITVQAGDIVGLRVQSDRCDMKLWPGGTSSTNNTVYHETFDEGSALPNIFDDVTVCSSYNTDEVSPYITAVVGKEAKKVASNFVCCIIFKILYVKLRENTMPWNYFVPRVHNSAMFSTKPVNEAAPTSVYPMETGILGVGSPDSGRPAMAGAEDSGGNMVILTSVGASVGVLLVVAAVLTAVLCVWQCSRRRSKCFSEVLHEGMMPGTYLNGRRSIYSVQYYILTVSQSAAKNPPHFAVVENEAYGVHTKHPQQQHIGNGREG